jgi:hypothetical protein
MDTSDTADIPEPIIPKATRNHGETLSPSKNVVSRIRLEAKKEITIRREK